jgi:hypothetical protein
MRIHRKLGRFRAVIAALVLAVGGLAAVFASPQPAAAAGECTPLFQTVIPQWETVQPEGPSGGITLCLGVTPGIGIQDGYMQIVDLTAGAKVRLITDPCHLGEGCNAKYHVRTADEWASWIQSNPNINPDGGAAHIHPDPSRLYSVSNAAFFNQSSNPTTLSLPFVQHTRADTGFDFAQVNDGGALNNTGDPAWDSNKRAITFGDQLITPQEVQMLAFPTHYTHDDVVSPPFVPADGQNEDCGFNNGLGCEWDATVGFTPDSMSAGSGDAPRTYVGISGDETGINTVYILNTKLNVSVSDAQNILESFGSQLELQFDGGESTQLWGNGGANLIDSPIGRGVPMVLAVYGS